jgi:hypothetical protein
MPEGPNRDRNGDGSSAAYEKPLRESLEDASVLLWYAAREGKQVSKETIGDIVDAQSKLRAGIRDKDVEGKFWAAFRELAAAVKPASIDSILATYSYPFDCHHSKSGKQRLADARATKKRYTWGAGFVLFALLVVQAYWFVGNTFSASLEKHRDELDALAGALRSMAVQFDKEPPSADNKLQKLSYTTIFQDLVQYDSTLSKWIETLNADEQLAALANLDVDNKSYRICRVFKLLGIEIDMLKWYYISTGQKTLSDGDVCSFTSETTYLGKIKEEKDKSNTIPFGEIELSLSKSKSTLAILSQYVLPLLYGLLGSLAYILRTISSEIQNVTFTRGSEIRYSLRWPLGMLAGVTVSLFFDPTHFSGFAAITPLGLAFLAGYGVELLFTGLDGMVGAFTGGGTARSKAA